MTHWVAVTVLVPVRTPSPSLVKAEAEALEVVRALVAPPLHVTASRWVRQEP